MQAVAGAQFEREIREQPSALARLLAQRPAIEELASNLRAFSPRFALIAARGSSDNAARYAQYLFGVHNEMSVGLAVPSLVTLYGASPKVDHGLVLGVSQSGQSPDIVAVLRAAREQGAATIALTNDPHSPLARTCEHCIDLCAGEERSVAATKTYTNELLALAMLSTALAPSEARWRELMTVPDLARAAIERGAAIGELARRHADARQFLVVGRGFNYSTAFEIALKIKETSLIMADSYSSADLMHGPLAMIDADLPVLVCAVSGKALGEVPELVEVLTRRGARLLLLSDREDLAPAITERLPLPQVPEWLSPIVAVIPGQLLALGLSRAKRLDPDQPRGLSKVTRTH